MSDKPDLDPPRTHAASAVVFRAKDRRPPVDTTLIPPLVGRTRREAFRADQAIVNEVDDHMDRLAARAGGLVISRSETIRSLLREGARSFNAKFRDEEHQPLTATESDNDDE